MDVNMTAHGSAAASGSETANENSLQKAVEQHCSCGQSCQNVDPKKAALILSEFISHSIGLLRCPGYAAPCLGFI